VKQRKILLLVSVYYSAQRLFYRGEDPSQMTQRRQDSVLACMHAMHRWERRGDGGRMCPQRLCAVSTVRLPLGCIHAVTFGSTSPRASPHGKNPARTSRARGGQRAYDKLKISKRRRRGAGATARRSAAVRRGGGRWNGGTPPLKPRDSLTNQSRIFFYCTFFSAILEVV
jgi:hypothetical protein